MFRTFTLRKVEELVGYGLGGAKAPSLKLHAGKHLEAHDYHEQMKKKVCRVAGLGSCLGWRIE